MLLGSTGDWPGLKRHAGLHTSITNGPIIYELDGIPYVVVGAGDTLYTFALTLGK